MSEQQPDDRPDDRADDLEQQVVVVGPDGRPVGTVPASALAGAEDADQDDDERAITDLVEQPAKVMRIGSMIRQLLEEVKAAPLDEASRNRLKEIHQASIKELEEGLAPELVEELERLTLPFSENATPSDGELRIAQAQLVGWLEGLFHGIQTAIYAQQMAARAQFEQIRRALPPGAMGPQADAGPQPQQPQVPGDSGGMYL
ncbi:bacterial proteasome activator family protein [Nocardioides sp.]|uniref:bacterial proteasome activator family protein n=1 Tax=Nocardioides sp. TaxID=35761 RepID=UPI003783D62A